MRLIGFTAEGALPEEHLLIGCALDCGVDIIHLRKPAWSQEQMAGLISSISPKYYDRLTLHDHFALAMEFGLGGVHLNSRCGVVPAGFEGRVSRSFHTLEELEARAVYSYVTLSPIFDSISKVGYSSRFDVEVLAEAYRDGVIDGGVIALGGICPENIGELRRSGFGGAAVLGCLWSEPTVKGVEKIIEKLKNNIKLCYNL